MQPEENNQPLHHYWSEKVQVKRTELGAAKNHLKAYVVRHRYTNYDQLTESPEFLELDPLERSRVIAVIKYECTSQALQCINGLIRDQLEEIKEETKRLEADVIRRDGIIGAITKLLWGNEREIKSLKAKIRQQKLEIKSLKEIIEEATTEAEYRHEIEAWKIKYEESEKGRLQEQKGRLEEQKRRRILGRNNQSLGGTAAHAERWREERDLLSDLLDLAELDNAQLSKEIETTKKEASNGKRLLNDYKVLARKLKEEINSLKNKRRKND